MPLLAIWAMLVIAIASVRAQSGTRVSTVTGCWQASRPLGPTGGALSVPRDAPFTSIVLRDSGRVVLPLLNDRERAMWEARSYWSASGDSVDLTIFTGLQGWRTRLSTRALPNAMAGTATYLTDVIVANTAPLQVAVNLSRAPCQADWATRPITTRIPRSWERGQQPYFEFQVERPAALAAGTKLPMGVRSMRALGRDEQSDARADRPEIVVAMFIVASDGRVDTGWLKLLYADGAPGPAHARDAVAAILASVRFTPPMVGGQAVNQLATWRIERVKR